MKAFNVRTVLGAISAASTRFAAKLVSVLVVAFFVCAHAYAQDARSLRVYYPFDNAVVSDSYLGNHPTLIKVDSVAAAAIGIDDYNLTIISYSSPEGNYEYNKALSTRRAAALRNYIIKKHPELKGRIKIDGKGESWDDLRQAVETDSNLSAKARSAMLRIINSNASPDSKEEQLKQFDSYWRLYRAYFRRFRYAEIQFDGIEFDANGNVVIPGKTAGQGAGEGAGQGAGAGVVAGSTDKAAGQTTGEGTGQGAGAGAVAGSTDKTAGQGAGAGVAAGSTDKTAGQTAGEGAGQGAGAGAGVAAGSTDKTAGQTAGEGAGQGAGAGVAAGSTDKTAGQTSGEGAGQGAGAGIAAGAGVVAGSTDKTAGAGAGQTAGEGAGQGAGVAAGSTDKTAGAGAGQTTGEGAGQGAGAGVVAGSTDKTAGQTAGEGAGQGAGEGSAQGAGAGVAAGSTDKAAGQTAGEGAGQTAGAGAGQTAGEGAGQTAGAGAGQTAGEGAGQGAGAGVAAGSTDKTAGQTAGEGAGQGAGAGVVAGSTDKAAGQTSGEGAGQTAGEGAGQGAGAGAVAGSTDKTAGAGAGQGAGEGSAQGAGAGVAAGSTDKTAGQTAGEGAEQGAGAGVAAGSTDKTAGQTAGEGAGQTAGEGAGQGAGAGVVAGSTDKTAAADSTAAGKDAGAAAGAAGATTQKDSSDVASSHAGAGALNINAGVPERASADATSKKFRNSSNRDNILFETQKTDINPDYEGNDELFAEIAKFLESHTPEEFDSLVVVSGCSIDGPTATNERVSRQRGQALYDWINKNYPQYKDKLHMDSRGEDWDKFRESIVLDKDLDDDAKSRILTIIDSDDTPARKEERLRELPEWDSHIKDNVLPQNRYSGLRSVFTKKEEPKPVEPVAPEAPELEDVEIAEDTLAVSDTTMLVPTDTLVVDKITTPEKKYPLFAAGSNLLYDLAITPNIHAELPIGKKWSVYADYTFPWWLTRDNSRAYQMLKWDLGARRYLNRMDENDPMDILRGHFLGLDLSAGYYDFEPHHKGVQGEFQLAGLEYGYTWKMGDNWRLEAVIGAGFMGTHYRSYKADATDRHLIYQKSEKLYWFGPTKAGISVKYIFDHYKKDKQGR